MDSYQSKVQSSLKVWPNSAQLRERLSIPLSLSICPTSQQNNNASFNDKNLEKYRCQSCKAFINKFCIIKSQNEYNCSLCGFSNYMEQKINVNSIQLVEQSYKCKASKLQRTIVSKQRVFVFILDFSNYSQVSQKYLLYSLHAIKSFLSQALSSQTDIKVMFLGFDDGLQLFHIRNQIRRLVFWTDQPLGEYPFSNDQIGTLKECKDNLMLIIQQLEQQAKQMQFRSNCSSNTIMHAIQYALKHTKTQSGKIFVVSGLNHELQKFKVMRNYDLTIQDAHKNHLPTIKKQCLSQCLQMLLSCSEMSLSIFMHNFNYINLLPFYIITKTLNGQLRHYFRQQAQHFFYQFNYLLHQCLYDLKYQTLLRVRTGIGLKSVGIFGNCRQWKGITEQVEMFSCQTTRKYVFEFIVEGRINSNTTVVQFSVLYTDLKGNRFYKIITHQIQLSHNIQYILEGINYQIVNFTFLKAVLHNMDMTPHFRRIQQALQQRCTKHIRTIRQITQQKGEQTQQKKGLINQKPITNVHLSRARSYTIFTYMLMKHFLLNLPANREISLDLNIQARSKISTFDQCIKIVWPIVYVVDENKAEIVEMNLDNYEQATVGIVIDRGDHVYIYVKDFDLRNRLRQAKHVKSLIQEIPSLHNIYSILQDIEERKAYPHLNILILQKNFTHSFDIFSRKGNHSFEAFVSFILAN